MTCTHCDPVVVIGAHFPFALSRAFTSATDLGRQGKSKRIGKAHQVIVVGSINMDLRATAEDCTWPVRDATVMGRFSQSPGGKGANEAVALARLGMDAVIVGVVGKDSHGEQLVTLLVSCT